MSEIGFTKIVAGGHAEVIERVRAGLSAVGFGIVSEISVSRILKEKLDVDFRPYVILGACQPALALAAINADPNAGLLLPCQVVVEDTGDGIAVRYIRPEVALAALMHLDDVRAVADDAGPRLAQMLAAL